MSKLKVLSLSCMLALAALPGPAFGQYIYIDANGDGVNTSADSLNAAGPTVLTIYLNTNHDKDSSLQTCNSHSAANCGATGTAQPLNIEHLQLSDLPERGGRDGNVGDVHSGFFRVCDASEPASGQP